MFLHCLFIMFIQFILEKCYYLIMSDQSDNEESHSFDVDFAAKCLRAGRQNIPDRTTESQKTHQSGFSTPVDSEDDDVEGDNQVNENSQNDDDDVRNSLKSQMWNHYIRLDDGIAAQCKIRDKVIKTTNCSTSGLWRHIRNIHKDVALPSATEIHKKAKIEYMKNNCETAVAITQKIAMYVIKDLQSYSAVDGPGFADLIHYFQPNYRIPARTTFSRNVIPKIHDAMKAKIKEDILQDVQASKYNIALIYTHIHNVYSELQVIVPLTLKYGYEMSTHTVITVRLDRFARGLPKL